MTQNPDTAPEPDTTDDAAASDPLDVFSTPDPATFDPGVEAAKPVEPVPADPPAEDDGEPHAAVVEQRERDDLTDLPPVNDGPEPEAGQSDLTAAGRALVDGWDSANLDERNALLARLSRALDDDSDTGTR